MAAALQCHLLPSQPQLRVKGSVLSRIWFLHSRQDCRLPAVAMRWMAEVGKLHTDGVGHCAGQEVAEI